MGRILELDSLTPSIIYNCSRYFSEHIHLDKLLFNPLPTQVCLTILFSTPRKCPSGSSRAGAEAH